MMEILLTAISFIAGWIISHVYSRQGSKDMKQLNDGLQRDNRELRTIVEKLPAEVAKTLATDDRQHLSLTEMNDVLRTLVTSTEKRPLVQVGYSWQEGEPKDKPFVITNSGDDEARNIQVQPIVLDEKRSFRLAPVGQLMPSGLAVERVPEPVHEAGMLFRTLIDNIEMAVDDRTRELKTTIARTGELIEQLDDHVRAEQGAIDEYDNIPVTVTYEDRHGNNTTLRYRLSITMFAHLTKAELDFIGDGDARPEPAPARTIA